MLISPAYSRLTLTVPPYDTSLLGLSVTFFGLLSRGDVIRDKPALYISMQAPAMTGSFLIPTVTPIYALPLHLHKTKGGVFQANTVVILDCLSCTLKLLLISLPPPPSLPLPPSCHRNLFHTIATQSPMTTRPLSMACTSPSPLLRLDSFARCPDLASA